MKNRSTVKLLSFVLAFLAVIMILPLGALRVNAVDDEVRATDQSTDERIWASDETETEEETELPSHIVDNGAKDANVTAPNVTKNGSAVDLRSATTIANGVYALKNIGNANCWMGVESSNVNPGYHMWQKLSTTSPTDSFDRSCLFKITKVAGADRYIIRSMLNNRLSFGFSGSQVITKEIPPNDQDVNIYDTFTITINSSTGYITISPYGNGNYVIAPNRGATAGAYLYKKTTVSAPNQIYWQPFQYTGAVKSSINIPFAPTNWNYGGKVGTEYTLKLITWTTEIGANTPYMTVHSDYSNRAPYSWSSTNYTLTVIPLKEGPIGITSIIRRDGTTTAFRTFLSVYSIIPEFDGKTAYIQNCGTGRYIDLELVNYTPTDIVQEYSFSTGTQQQWTFEVAYGGFFYIKSIMSGMYIGVDPSSTASVKQYADQSDYTLWRFKRTTSGDYTIACKATESSGKVLSAPPNSTASGANLTMYTYVDGDDYCDEWKTMDEVSHYLGILQYWNDDEISVSYWNEPVPLCVDNKVNESNFYFDAGVLSAKNQWGNALNLQFVNANISNAKLIAYGLTASDYKILTGKDWTDGYTGLCSFTRTSIGYARFNDNIRTISKQNAATVYVVYNPDAPRPEASLKKTVVHEFGHALGYIGHSPTTTDVMYSTAHTQYTLSTNEKNHLAQIYALMN